MKKLPKAILIVAILNILALLGGVGWIFATGRLSKDRVQELASLFSEPVAQEEARIKAEEDAAAKALAEQEKPLPDLALNAEERNRVRVEMTQVDRQRLERTKQEVQIMQAALRLERQSIDQARKDLEQELSEFDEMRNRLNELEGTEQFKKSLDTLNSMSPKDSTKVIQSLLDESKNEEALAYLSAMDSRTRSQIMTQMVKGGDQQLAAKLLEDLRVYGLEAVDNEESN